MLLIQILICLSIKLKFVSVENTFLGPRSSSQSQKKEIHGRWSLQIECSYAKRNHPYLSKPLKKKHLHFLKLIRRSTMGLKSHLSQLPCIGMTKKLTRRCATLIYNVPTLMGYLTKKLPKKYLNILSFL